MELRGEDPFLRSNSAPVAPDWQKKGRMGEEDRPRSPELSRVNFSPCDENFMVWSVFLHEDILIHLSFFGNRFVDDADNKRLQGNPTLERFHPRRVPNLRRYFHRQSDNFLLHSLTSVSRDNIPQFVTFVNHRK